LTNPTPNIYTLNYNRDLSKESDHLKGPSVIPDNYLCGQLAARHFISRRFHHFAYLGVQGAYYASERRRGFRETLEKEAIDAEFHSQELIAQSVYLDASLPNNLQEWITSLPRPLGLFAGTDGLARQVVQVCEQRAIRCPDEIAVLGVDNDELECAISPVKLSSVALPFNSIGRIAGATLHTLLENPDKSAEIPAARVLPPVGIVTRRSTELLAVEDTVIRKAMEWIRERSSQDTNVTELAQLCGVSRRYLERRFQTVLGCSPKNEIIRYRIQRVQFMLAETTLTVTEIAYRLGFREPKYLHRLFRKSCGCSPVEYRNSFRR
jgi:LacI family transcriptional regulator